VRGAAGNRGRKVPRQFPVFFARGNSKPFSNGSGRLELARAIAHPENPLTARVIVNRVWMHHFGRGLVTTPSDFGLQSDPPSHPELLDFLAAWFIENGWSIKKLHKLILLSSTWRQSSDATPALAEAYGKKDPENALLWRMNRRRLEFESMRDAMLMAAGKLDLKMGGIAVDLQAHPYSNRRTVYGLIERQNLASMFRTFDFANPDSSSAGRFSTTVPQQALYLMNSPFAIEQARNVTRRPDVAGLDQPEERISRLHEILLQRRPSSEEISGSLKFLEGREAAFRTVDARNRWSHGYGRFDESAGRVTEFTKLPYFNGRTWQGGPNRPDPELGYLLWNDKQGHTGENPNEQAILRWISPVDGDVSVQGKLKHPSDKGDGVRLRIASSSGGVLGEFVVLGNETLVNLKGIHVTRGQAIDFVVDCVGNTSFDTFEFAPRIRTKDGGREWSSLREFNLSDPRVQPLNAWEQLAQALALSNEFMFVD